MTEKEYNEVYINGEQLPWEYLGTGRNRSYWLNAKPTEQLTARESSIAEFLADLER